MESTGNIIKTLNEINFLFFAIGLIQLIFRIEILTAINFMFISAIITFINDYDKFEINTNETEFMIYFFDFVQFSYNIFFFDEINYSLPILLLLLILLVKENNRDNKINLFSKVNIAVKIIFIALTFNFFCHLNLIVIIIQNYLYGWIYIEMKMLINKRLSSGNHFSANGMLIKSKLKVNLQILLIY